VLPVLNWELVISVSFRQLTCKEKSAFINKLENILTMVYCNKQGSPTILWPRPTTVVVRRFEGYKFQIQNNWWVTQPPALCNFVYCIYISLMWPWPVCQNAENIINTSAAVWTPSAISILFSLFILKCSTAWNIFGIECSGRVNCLSLVGSFERDILYK